MDGIREKVIKGVVWRFAERFGAQIVSFIVSVVLARLLSPSDYGEITLVMLVVSVLQILVDSGFGNALIQKKDVDDLDYSTVFVFNIAFCIILYALLYMLAPCISKILFKTDMTLVLRCVCVIVLISGVKNIQQAYVSRNMQFKKFFFATLGGTILSAVVDIVLAYKGYGIWALVAQYIINPLIDTIILWRVVEWKPSFRFSMKRLTKLFSYGWKLLAVAIMTEVFNDLRNIIIGKIYSTEDLGYYSNGQKVPQLLTQNIDASIKSVMFPAFASEQSNVELVKLHMLKMIKITNYVLFPVLFGIAACAENIVIILWTEKWIQVVPFLRVASVMLALNSMQGTNQQAIIALGHSQVNLVTDIVIKVVGLLLLLMSMRHGVFCIALSGLVTTVIALFINMWPNTRILKCKIREQLLNTLPEGVTALTMAIIVYIVGQQSLFPPVLSLMLQILAGIVIYVALSILFSMNSYQVVKKILLDFLGVKNGE